MRHAVMVFIFQPNLIDTKAETHTITDQSDTLAQTDLALWPADLTNEPFRFQARMLPTRVRRT